MCSDATVFPDLNDYLGEYSVITDGYVNKTTKNITQVGMNQNYPLRQSFSLVPLKHGNRSHLGFNDSISWNL